ncbi:MULTISPECIES: ABC transporter permease [unclassified Bradyrhizobium]|uniref:ABC transporter permease n=1 Tax=unclassified Bradyrhizobium TaxID=2631580 RepID=UPI001FF96540|nr:MULTISPECIES: ABC transporter permease [unclassified Bradyrhizobium]
MAAIGLVFLPGMTGEILAGIEAVDAVKRTTDRAPDRQRDGAGNPCCGLGRGSPTLRALRQRSRVEQISC